MQRLKKSILPTVFAGAISATARLRVKESDKRAPETQAGTASAGRPHGFTARSGLSLALAVAAGFALLSFVRANYDPGEDLSDQAWIADMLAAEGPDWPSDAASGAVTFPVGGNPAGDVTVLVFSDYACSICRISDPELEQAAKADGAVRIVYRPWPVFGPPSERAARIALASAPQGVFPEVNARLLEGRGLSEADLRRAVEDAGGDFVRAEQELAVSLEAIDAQLSANHKAAFRLSLKGTPAYLVGPYLLRGKANSRMFTRAFELARQKQR
jgi:protein-disulfide isomerase